MHKLACLLVLFSFNLHSAECLHANGGQTPAESIPGVISSLADNVAGDQCENDEDNLDVRVTTPLGVMTFMEGLIGEMGRPESFYQDFMGSRYATSKNKRMLKRFLKWHEKTKNSSAPQEQAGMDTTQELVKLAATTENEKDFLKAAKKKLGNSSFRQFSKFYNRFKPIYKNLVEDKQTSALKGYLKTLKSEGCKWKMKDKTKCLAKFTRSNPAAAANSPIGLYPSTSQGAVDGQSFVGVEILAVDPTSNDIHGDLSVVLHEKFHTLFHTQGTKKYEEMKKWFGEGEQAELAFLNFEEAIATIAGNVWAYKKVTGEKPREPWYNVPSIDLYAKAIAPKMEEYLNGCKPMDKSFIDLALKEYSKLPASVKKADRKQLKEMSQGQ
ncbi:MAG: hypothetical protein EP319_12525 [Deltaproteobacteria bacterium]|nr:MAG: hypothetical protein EP319_12525 [Deltaproteobacteria bacterium]